MAAGLSARIAPPESPCRSPAPARSGASERPDQPAATGRRVCRGIRQSIPSSK